MANSSGYSISIKALDEASAQIKRINNALKELQSLDKDAESGTTENAERSRSRFATLNKGILDFGKNAKKELTVLAKNFAEVGGKIGATIETLGKAFNLGGLAIGAGLAVKGIEEIGKAFVRAGTGANDLLNDSRKLGISLEQLQRFQERFRLYDISPGDVTGGLKHLAKLQFAARQNRLPANISNMFNAIGIPDIRKVPLDVLMDKVLRSQLSGEVLKGFPGGPGQVATEIFGNEKFADVWAQGKKFYDEQVEAAKNIAVLSNESAEAFKHIHDDALKVQRYFDEVVTKLEDFVGHYLPGIEKWIKENPGTAAATTAVVGGGLGTAAWFAGKRLLSGIGNLFNSGLIKALGEAGKLAPDLAPEEIAAGVGWLARLGQLAKYGSGFGAFIATMWPKPAGEGEDEAVRKRNEEYAKTHPGWTPPAYRGKDGSVTAPIPRNMRGPDLNQKAFEAISRSEGTMGKNGEIDYNMLPRGEHDDLTGNSIAYAIQKSREKGDGVGGFAELDTSIEGAAKALGLDLNEKFSPENQRKIANQLYRMQTERAWHGLMKNPDEMRKFNDAMGGAGPQSSLIGGGRFSAGSVNLRHVNNALTSSIQAASAFLPEGYSVKATSGERTGGLRGSQHHGGNALDVEIIGPDGKPLANRGTDTSGMYRQLAHSWFNQVSKMYPNLASSAAWGGEFETTPGSRIADLMHFDFGGRRGRMPRNDWRYIDSDYNRTSDGNILRRADPVTNNNTENGSADPILKEQPKPKQDMQSSPDSRHVVEFNINNAPLGSRSRITESNGDADLNIRTRYAMGVV